MGLSVILITKNEAHNLARALGSVGFADEIIVVDSGSTDGTQALARNLGAKVVETIDWPGYGPQKNFALSLATQDWVLSLDADEWLTDSLANEIQKIINANDTVLRKQAYWIRRKSIYIDRTIRWGDWRGDRVLRLFRRVAYSFSQDQVHEKLIPVSGSVGSTADQEATLKHWLMHHPVKTLYDSIVKMWAYNRIAANRLAARSKGGLFAAITHSFFTFFRGFVLRAGFFDGVRGAQLAWYNAKGTYIRYRMAGEILATERWRRGEQTNWDRLADWLNLMLIDHGFLRLFYSNLWRLPGGLYRSNQPTPRDLSTYVQRYGIRTVVNLRGENEQLGWYRLEKGACQEMGLTLLNVQVFSRGLLDQMAFNDLVEAIRSIELPALVHCKSGADRAGFFSVVFRHARLGEPMEDALDELGWRYGHFKAAKTGVLDHFFHAYLREREKREAFFSWMPRSFSKQMYESSFVPSGLSSWLVDRLLRRE